MYLGDFYKNDTVKFSWNTYDSDGSSITRATNGSIIVFEEGSSDPHTAISDISDNEDYGGLVGIHYCEIETTGSFFEHGKDYIVAISGATIDGQSVNGVLAQFSLKNRADDGVLHYGTADGGSSSYIDLETNGDPAPSTINGAYDGCILVITGGTGAGQVRQVYAYSTINNRLTVYEDFTTTPDSTSEYKIYANGNHVDVKEFNASALTTATYAGENFVTFFEGGGALTSVELNDVTGVRDANLVSVFGSADDAQGLGSMGNEVFNFGYASMNVAYINASNSNVSYLDSMAADYGSDNAIDANITQINYNSSNVSYLDSLASDYGSDSMIDVNVEAIEGTTLMNGSYVAQNFDTFFGNNITTTSKVVDDIGSVTGVADANLVSISGQVVTDSAGINFNLFFDNNNSLTTKVVEDVGADPTGTLDVNVITIEGTDATDQLDTSIDTAITNNFNLDAGVVEADVIKVDGSTDAANTLQEYLDALPENTATAGGAASITLAVGSSASNDYYNNATIIIVSGTGAGQVRVITDYDGGTRVATVGQAWGTQPDNTSKYQIIGVAAT